MENRENIGWDEVLEGGLAPYSELAAPEEDWLGSLNEAQREAVTTTEGYVRVIAGAGTGKTRALAYRFAYLANVLGILPGHILCATFTNKAAGEMRRRIRRLIGDADTGLINTFHGLRVAVLQADGHALQLPKSFSVLDNGDIDAMLAIVYEERGLTLRERTYAQARDKIEMLKTRDRTDYFHDFIAMGDDELKRRYAEAETVDDIIFYGHLLQQKKSFGLDYNDLIILTLHLFDTCPEVRRAWQERMEYVMVDEFQDIDGLQYALMEALAGHHGNLFVVGDPDQTIYTWRGANVRYLTEFDAHFHGTRTIIMLENHRSVPQVLSAANSLIARNRQRIAKDLLARRTDAGPAVWYHGADSPAEAAWIAEGVRALHGAGVAYGDIAVLYRAHYASRAVEEAFIREQIPHTVYSGTPFFARREVKDALSYLRLIATKNDLDFRRVANVPQRNLGRRRMKYLEEAAEREGTTLYEALEAHIGDDIFKGTGAADFLKLVETFSATYAERPVSAVLADLLQASGYERLLRSPMPPEYLAQAREAHAAADRDDAGDRLIRSLRGDEGNGVSLIDHVNAGENGGRHQDQQARDREVHATGDGARAMRRHGTRGPLTRPGSGRRSRPAGVGLGGASGGRARPGVRALGGEGGASGARGARASCAACGDTVGGETLGVPRVLLLRHGGVRVLSARGAVPKRVGGSRR